MVSIPAVFGLPKKEVTEIYVISFFGNLNIPLSTFKNTNKNKVNFANS
jgi:hypothetical protein